MAEKPRLKSTYLGDVAPGLFREFGYSNLMEVPKPTKVVLNIGLGEAIDNRNALDAALGDLTTIAGQKPVIQRARKSISNFKLREGMQVGLSVTLRSNRMWDFLDRLINLTLPRVRDFHGVSRRSFDGRGNYSLGISEQIVFPEIDYNSIDRLRGLQVNIVTTAKTDEEGRRMLELLGMPFERIEDSA
ncbi:MAG: 50S ribosomal protein L5 [Chloroflexi bacterium]|nr:50S ribosomal protein L5 [Chloroflexota bacterium]